MKKHELSDKEVLQYIRQKTDKINSKFENKLKPLSTARNKKVAPGGLKITFLNGSIFDNLIFLKLLLITKCYYRTTKSNQA